MNKHDRAKMRDRFIKALATRLRSKELTVDNMIDFTEREVDRAVRAERVNQHVCIDCKTVLVPQPLLCGSCYSTRGDEGMDTDDMRTIQTWRKQG